jgi:uncharacterized protein (DUF983 family)
MPVETAALPAARPAAPRPRLRDVLRRGLRGRCPQCGEGPLFVRWITAYERCSACGLQFERNYGDTWMFIILLDRVPILFGIVAVYFGFRATHWLTATAFFIALAGPMIATVRHRQGLALALDYLSRLYLPDPSDELHGGRTIAR